jgi:hypothetical protein
MSFPIPNSSTVATERGGTLSQGWYSFLYQLWRPLRNLFGIANNRVLFMNGGVVDGLAIGAGLTLDPIAKTLTASGSSGGSVSSVDLSGAPGRIVTNGGPITTSGVIGVDLSASGVTPGAYANADITVDAFGRITVAASGTIPPSLVPYFVPPAETFEVPLYSQALFALPIDVEGSLVVDGFLVEVD